MTFGTAIFLSVGIAIVLGFLAHLAGQEKPLPEDPEARADELERRWRERRFAEGATWEDIEPERQIRMALAALRHNTTRAVIEKPQDYEDIIAAEKKRQADQLRYSLGKGQALKFLRICAGLRLSDILYPNALDAVRKANGWDKIKPGKFSKEYHEIRAAAFTDLP